MKDYTPLARIEITKESGEVIKTLNYASEIDAQNGFDHLESIKSPITYDSLVMNLSDYPEGRIGSVRLIVQINSKDYCRRELFRKP